jgi:hypothetical protein
MTLQKSPGGNNIMSCTCLPRNSIVAFTGCGFHFWLALSFLRGMSFAAPYLLNKHHTSSAPIATSAKLEIVRKKMRTTRLYRL